MGGPSCYINTLRSLVILQKFIAKLFPGKAVIEALQIQKLKTIWKLIWKLIDVFELFLIAFFCSLWTALATGLTLRSVIAYFLNSSKLLQPNFKNCTEMIFAETFFYVNKVVLHPFEKQICQLLDFFLNFILLFFNNLWKTKFSYSSTPKLQENCPKLSKTLRLQRLLYPFFFFVVLFAASLGQTLQLFILLEQKGILASSLVSGEKTNVFIWEFYIF